VDNVIDGAVITFIDINELKTKQEQLEKEIFEKYSLALSNKYLEETLDLIQKPIFILDKNMEVIYYNSSFKKTFKINQKKDLILSDLLNNQRNVDYLNKIFVDNIMEEDFLNENQNTIQLMFKRFGKNNFLYKLRIIKNSPVYNSTVMILISTV
jgi:transcriptional regulator with PAS, ATPase and Fis domain